MRSRRREKEKRRDRGTAAIALFIAGCAFSPLAHRIKVGEEPFVVFTGEGRDRHTDLFALHVDGGSVVQLTFTPLIEQSPRLTPAGDVVAFVRMRDTLPDAHRDVVLTNLLSYGETVIALPTDAGKPLTLAWNDDATALYIRTDRGTWRAAAPPAATAVTAVAPAEMARADSALDLWLGSPRFTRATPCAKGVCVITPAGDTASLAPLGHDAMRWGNDSVAWFEQDAIVVRSLGPGHERRLTWKEGPANARGGSYARGPAPLR